MQDWLELGKGCRMAPGTKGQVIRVEVERDDAMHYGAVNELQAVASRDTEDCQRARSKLNNGSLLDGGEKLRLADRW